VRGSGARPALCFRGSTATVYAISSGDRGFALNAVMATALGFVVYFRLIRTIRSMGTASVSYLKPAAGVLIGCTLLGETLTWTTALGLIAILTGVAAINPKASTDGYARANRNRHRQELRRRALRSHPASDPRLASIDKADRARLIRSPARRRQAVSSGSRGREPSPS
jgi:hypothetical protein